jgi:manganese transport protein
LYLLAPLVAEYLLGDFPVTRLPLLFVLAPVYGGAALLIREVTRRAGRGWPTILLLALAFGLLLEGVVGRIATVAHRPVFDVVRERLGPRAGIVLLTVFAAALWRFGPDWGHLLDQTLHPAVPRGEGRPRYFYHAIALLGVATTPYEVFFFSSGAMEECWTPKDLPVERANTFIGFPLGGRTERSSAAPWRGR